MKKVGPIIILFFAFADALAQGQVFKMKYEPATIYTISQNTTSFTQINFTGDKAEIAKLPVTQLPIVLQNKTSLKYAITTGALNSQKGIPVTAKYLGTDIKDQFNGQQTNANIDTLKGRVLAAVFTADGKLQFDTSGTKRATDSLKKMAAAMFYSIQLNFPESVLKIGDSFNQDVPMQINAGGKAIALSTHLVYKLTSLKNNIAFFDVNQTADSKENIEGGKMQINAKGEGFVIYDTLHNFFKVYQNSLNLNFTVEHDKLTMAGSVNTISVYQVDITKQ